MENSFHLVHTVEDDKVQFATYMLMHAALKLWCIEKISFGPRENPSFVDFKCTFCKTYIPNSVVSMMRQKFRNLKQAT